MKCPVIFWSSDRLQENLEVSATRCNQRFLLRGIKLPIDIIEISSGVLRLYEDY